MGGKTAMWCVVGIGLFTSIGFPNIFSLALDGMGVLKGQASSLLVMAIVGGALLAAASRQDRGLFSSMPATNTVCNTRSSFRLSRMLTSPFTVGKAIKLAAPGRSRLEILNGPTPGIKSWDFYLGGARHSVRAAG